MSEVKCHSHTLISDEPIPILLALIMGLQHAFAMVGGLITPPLVVFKVSFSYRDVAFYCQVNVFRFLSLRG